MNFRSPPKDNLELKARALNLAGKTLQELANEIDWQVPPTQLRAKGWIGQLIEVHLGASAGNLSEPDFPHLGIELKTLPFNQHYEPQETTYVCTAPFDAHHQLETWETSRVRRKLNKVLWIPVEADKTISLAERRVGCPCLVELDLESEIILKQDWEELMELLALGQFDRLSARQGRYLQIRPKAAHSRILISTVNEDGANIDVGPKGFYLRTEYTRRILKNFI